MSDLASSINLAKDSAAMQIVATALFACAVLHTFAVKKFQEIGNRMEKDSIGENLMHFLGEVEVVFGLWAGILVVIWSLRFGTDSSIAFLEGIDFSEAIFVLVIMCMSATRPVIAQASRLVALVARWLPLPPRMALYIASLTVGPLFGSLITEPGAMALTALILKPSYFDGSSNVRFKYATLGLLFVNVSVGGALTHFAAPPVLMVAKPWGWDTGYMLLHFGWKTALFIFIATGITAMVFRKELLLTPKLQVDPAEQLPKKSPLWIFFSHALFMALVIFHSHHASFIIPVFLLFLGWTEVTKEYQSDLKLRESLLVAFFLGGLVALGKLQGWWLQPLLGALGDKALFGSALALTAITDNAALTYLGTLVPELSETARIMLVAGAICGGGLTVIANAPNPIGYGILRDSFGEDGISPLGLLLGALPFTLGVSLFFLF